jgi:hypothetical protein
MRRGSPGGRGGGGTSPVAGAHWEEEEDVGSHAHMIGGPILNW